MLQPLFLLLLSAGTIFHLVHADLEFTTSFAQECTPLNITWKPDMNAFPYSVYFMVIGAQVQSWQLNSDYQPNAQEITFQYVLPKSGGTFQHFLVAVVDSKGNGNTSQVLTPKALSNHPSNCSNFALSQQWTYASDLISPKGASDQDRLECALLSYYPVDQLSGTAPFSYSLVPVQDKPITVNIPKSAQTSSSYFYYESILPLKQGTSFYQFMSDSQGSGDGGGSALFTVGPGQNGSCVQSGFKQKDLDTTHALPAGSNLASFQNLPGAIASAPDDSGSNVTSNNMNNAFSGQSTQTYGAKHLGGVLGGILGALFGLLLLAFIIYRVYRRHQKNKQQSHRMENAQFVDLGESILEQGPSSIRQSTLISPFLHASNGSAHGEVPNEDHQNSIGLIPISQSENSSALSTSLGDRSGTGLRRVAKSDLTRSGSDYGLSLANYTSDAFEALLDPANDSGNQSGSLQHGRHQSQGSDADDSMRFRSGSMYSSTSNPVSINGVLAENEISTAEANMNSMHDFSPTTDTMDQPAGVINRESRDTRTRASSTLIRMSNESVQTPDSRYVEHFDAGPVTHDIPPPYKFRSDQPSSPKT
ncbi:uncharacterized protein FA14DRAFT_184473 [Meira miltonrushii]|uniref:Fibronectin type-III domain-containing protein n=1 Tax=Meira miltonrushii TaxID=1280837 RepID=A0A316VFR1_9BASI|nr:uncharacterized protein FA14DRAFT_184473 [Meira miltonrushii]PWN35153.1 hypothetical protein FA14DRAFT_184473 [Meira miltonrushii]